MRPTRIVTGLIGAAIAATALAATGPLATTTVYHDLGNQAQSTVTVETVNTSTVTADVYHDL